MIDGAYKIYVDVPFGRRSGMIVLHTEGNTMFADIDAPVIGHQNVQGTADGDTFNAQGSGWVFPLGKIKFNIQGTVSGDDLQVDIKSNRGNISVEGTRI